MLREPQISLYDIILCLANTTDLVSPLLANHQKRVAYIAWNLGEELKLTLRERIDLILAGASHDLGALSLQERLGTLNFEDIRPQRHAEAGYRILREFDAFSEVARLVRFHHLPWAHGAGSKACGEDVPLGSHILHLADRIDVLLKGEGPVLGQAKSILTTLRAETGRLFAPELVEAFAACANKEFFWFDLTSPFLGEFLSRRAKSCTVILGLKDLASLARLFGHAIDFRSPFTAVHSSGVAATAEALARLSGMSERECQLMHVAGYMHDFGKLALPTEILEKPGPLTATEFDLVKSHPFHAHRLLEPIPEFDTLNAWISFHHERLDGSGYPFHLSGNSIPLGSRIMAVADVFTAVTEDRPYRPGMSVAEGLGVLAQMAAEGALDPRLVRLLQDHSPTIDTLREKAQMQSLYAFRTFQQQIESETAEVVLLAG